MELSAPKPDSVRTSGKKDWSLSPHAFQQLLSWLDQGTDSDGQNFLEMRQRLLAYFDRKNCPVPDELADEVLNRVARRIEEESSIESDTPAKYCFIVARFVFMEHLRETQKGRVALDEIRRQTDGGGVVEDDNGAGAELSRAMHEQVRAREPRANHAILCGKRAREDRESAFVGGELGHHDERVGDSCLPHPRQARGLCPSVC